MRTLIGALLTGCLVGACGNTTTASPTVASTPDAGTSAGPDGGGTAAGGGSPDAGPIAGGGSGGGSADAGPVTTGGGSGAAPDAGPTQLSECDGLAPGPVGAPNGTHTMSGYQVDCLATVDADSVLALSTSNSLNPQSSFTHFVSPDGTPRAATSPGTILNLVGRFSNFEGYEFTGRNGAFSYQIEAWDESGHRTSSNATVSGSVRVIEDPLDGITAFDSDSREVQNYDSSGHLRWRVKLAPEITALGGFVTDRTGNTFVMGDSSRYDKSVVAQWIDHDGNTSGSFQLFPPQSDWNHLEGNALVRVGSGVFVHVDSWWQLDSLSRAPTPAPAWVTSRNPGSLWMVRNGRGYGVISPPSGPDCTTTVEILAPSGASCGSARFNAGPGSQQPQCSFVSGMIGYDGTFVQRMPPPANECSGGTCSCTWHWWTGYFQ